MAAVRVGVFVSALVALLALGCGDGPPGPRVQSGEAVAPGRRQAEVLVVQRSSAGGAGLGLVRLDGPEEQRVAERLDALELLHPAPPDRDWWATT